MLEGRLREGFVRMRQLMVGDFICIMCHLTSLQALTRHEPRLRGPFNPLPYSALIFSLERFFEYLVEIRQSSIFFHPYYLSDDRQAAEALLTSRRDAVSAVLMNLYILASGLRIGRRIPRFLPNAAWARKRLLDQMALLETSRLQSNGSDGGRTINGLGSSENSSDRSTTAHSIHTSDTGGKGKEKADGDDSQHRKWSEVYSYSYSQSLTGCIQQLEQLQKYTKEICGEQGYLFYFPACA